MSEKIDSPGRIPTYLCLRSHKVKTVFMALPEERSCSVDWWNRTQCFVIVMTQSQVDILPHTHASCKQLCSREAAEASYT